jgi:hypothetical protein
MMDSIREIITLFGGMDRLRERSIRIEVEGFMPLCIEYVGEGPRGGILVSIAHYYLQNGDLMADPDLSVEVQPSGEWLPVAYQQDGLGIYQEAVYLERDKVIERQRLVNDLLVFMQMWDENIKEQGYVEAARRTCSDKSGG